MQIWKIYMNIELVTAYLFPVTLKVMEQINGYDSQTASMFRRGKKGSNTGLGHFHTWQACCSALCCTLTSKTGLKNGLPMNHNGL